MFQGRIIDIRTGITVCEFIYEVQHCSNNITVGSYFIYYGREQHAAVELAIKKHQHDMEFDPLIDHVIIESNGPRVLVQFTDPQLGYVNL